MYDNNEIYNMTNNNNELYNVGGNNMGINFTPTTKQTEEISANKLINQRCYICNRSVSMYYGIVDVEFLIDGVLRWSPRLGKVYYCERCIGQTKVNLPKIAVNMTTMKRFTQSVPSNVPYFKFYGKMYRDNTYWTDLKEKQVKKTEENKRKREDKKIVDREALAKKYASYKQVGLTLAQIKAGLKRDKEKHNE